MSNYSKYPSYKDSGVEWLGEIPEGWIATKVKYKAPYQVGWTPPTKHSENFDGENKWVTIGDLKGKFIATTKNCISDKAVEEASMDLTPKGSLLFSFKLSVGTVAFAGEDLYTNEAIASFLKNDRSDIAYLYYATPFFIIQNASENIYGAKILNQELISNATLALPPLQEQKAIAAYLDRATQKIDSLIAKQEQLIALLKEKRQALISHAVTKGLDPDAKMKESGVEWLGEIPEGWEVKKFKYLFEIRKRISGKLDFDVLSITQKGIKVKDIESGDGQLSSDYSKYQHVYKGDYAMNHMDLLTGFVDLSKFDGVTSPDYRVFSLIEKNANDEYYLYLLQMGYINKIFYPLGQGSSQFGRWRLPTDAFKEFVAPFPPKEEQERIAKYIKDSLSKFDALTIKATQAITLLKEKRTALISAVVTGKVKVNGEAREGALGQDVGGEVT